MLHVPFAMLAFLHAQTLSSTPHAVAAALIRAKIADRTSAGADSTGHGLPRIFSDVAD